VRRPEHNIKAYLRQFKEHERLRAALRFACGAFVALAPFYLLARAAAAWTPHPAYFPDDAFYARLCLPDGLALYWHDFGLYRLLTILPYALLNRAVMRAALSPALLSLTAVLCATLAFVWACLRAGLSRGRGALLAGVLLGSPLLLETVNFWSGTLNYALVLLVLAVQLRACVWARRPTSEPTERPAGESFERPAGESSERSVDELAVAVTGEPSKRPAGEASRRPVGELSKRPAGELSRTLRERLPGRSKGELWRGLIVTAGGALLALLTYEITLPFVIASSAFYARGWRGRLATLCVTGVIVLAVVAALAAAGLYWPQRFKLALQQLTPSASATVETPNPATGANRTANMTADATPVETATANETSPRVSSATERARMYFALLFSFTGTGLRSLCWWLLALALASAGLLSRRPPGEAARAPARAGRLLWGVSASAFAFGLAACVGYLALTKSMNARYVAFLLIYGAATVAWTKGRVAGYALASLLLVQAAVAAGLPVHMRDVEQAAREGTAVASSPPSRRGDLISIDGRLARASWGKRFLVPPAVDMLTQPLSPRACRYSVPCEECK